MEVGQGFFGNNNVSVEVEEEWVMTGKSLKYIINVCNSQRRIYQNKDTIIFPTGWQLLLTMQTVNRFNAYSNVCMDVDTDRPTKLETKNNET